MFGAQAKLSPKLARKLVFLKTEGASELTILLVNKKGFYNIGEHF